MYIKSQRLERLFDTAFATFLEEDYKELLKDVHEQNSCGRLAMCLNHEIRRVGLPGYYVDTEYNRKQDAKIKTIVNDNHQVIRIRCDLILHSRGEIRQQDNLIAVEMKKAGRPQIECDNDRLRLQLMTRKSYNGIWSTGDGTEPEHVCGYGLGVFIQINHRQRSVELEYFKSGSSAKRKVVPF